MILTKKKTLDYLPFLIVCLSAIISVFTMLSAGYILQWQHYLGFLFLAINGFIFYRQHQFGVLFLGLTLFLGLIGILSFSVGLSGSSIFSYRFDIKIPLGNPIMWLWLILHFILSGRYYVGIVTKQYWKTLFNDES